MSTAWYRSNVVPSMIRQWKRKRTRTRANMNDGHDDEPLTAAALLHTIQVWDTTCIVTNFGKRSTTTFTNSNARDDDDDDDGSTNSNTNSNTNHHHNKQSSNILISPANPKLSGVSEFPYFPKGGPQPTKQPEKDAHHIMGYVTQWGGMEVGQGMLFAANVVDGLVHQLGGNALASELATKHPYGCPEGQAVLTLATDELLVDHDYSHILHTVPPFYDLTDNALLGDCYRNSLQLIHQHHHAHYHDREQPAPTWKYGMTMSATTTATTTNNDIHVHVACPLLGAGCRSFPIDEAVDVVAQTLVDCLDTLAYVPTPTPTPLTRNGTESTGTGTVVHVTLALAIPSGEIRTALVEAIDQYYDASGASAVDRDPQSLQQ